MKTFAGLLAVVYLVILHSTPVIGQTKVNDEYEADRQALRALAARYQSAIGSGNLLSLQDSVAPDASAVFMTNDEVIGLEAMQRYFDNIRRQLGEGTSYSVKLNPSPTRFEGHIAIASGTSDEKVLFGNGKELDYQTKWTANLKKVDGKWLALRLHVSLDPINNPIVNLRSQAGKWLAGAGGAIGGVLACLFLSRLKRRSASRDLAK